MTNYINPSTRNGGVEQIVVPERAVVDPVNDAPFDDIQYVRVNGEWVPVDPDPDPDFASVRVGGEVQPRFHRQDSAGALTDAAGLATFVHGCSFTPTAVFVTMRSASGSFAVFWGTSAFTATQVTMRWMNAYGGPYVSANTGAWTALYLE